ncbi:MAG: DUF2796 domain-containing protein [Candidatus Thiodiazotropha sp.]
MYIFKSCFLFLLVAAVAPLAAEEHRQHGVHEHGVGTLNLAQDGTELHIELDSPAINIVGFEQAPNSEQDHQALQSALARLRDGKALFVLPETAGCRLMSAEVETPLENHREDKAHPGDAHDEEHQKAHIQEGEHHDGTDHGEGEHGQGHVLAAEHADIDAAWFFSCEHPDRLDGISVRLFEAFPRTQALQVQYVTEKQQGAARVNPSHPELRF